jgi:hypothetical protein
MKRAFLVLGAESSGTRLLTQILIAGGCHGDPSHEQAFDDWQFQDKTPIVWRRSYPWSIHRLWPNLALDLLRPLGRFGYEDIMVLISTRDWIATSRSQAAPENRHVADEEEALENMAIAYREIFRQVADAGLPSLVVAHEALCLAGERAARPLLGRLGLDDRAGLPPIDAGRNLRRYL